MNTSHEREDGVTRQILDVIEKQSDISQRFLSLHLGVALGLTNSYLKRCARKGLIKIRQAPANRYLYYLTPKGFSEKSRLTAQFLSSSLSFYRKAGESCLRIYDECERKGWKRLLLCGVSDLAEIATLRAMEREIWIVGYYEPGGDRVRFLGRPVFRDFGLAEPHDVCLLTDLRSPSSTYLRLQEIVARERILVPDVIPIETRAAISDGA